MRSPPAVFEICQIIEEAWKRSGNKQGRLAERKGQVCSVLPLACLMSEGYVQTACSSVSWPRSLLWTLCDSVETREGIDTDAESQIQIQALVLPRVRILSFSGHWREGMVHEVVTGMLAPQRCRVSMPTSNSCKDPQQHPEGSSKLSVSASISVVGQKVLCLSIGCSSLRWGCTSALPLYIHSMCWNQVLDQGNTAP